MTGWRVGYLAGPAPVLRVMATVQEQVASCVNAAAQQAALAALTGPQDCVEAVRRAYARRALGEALDRLDAGLRAWGRRS